MRIRVLNDKCQGHARCWSLAPDLFKLDNSGYILPGDIAVAPGQEQLAARGARACPERALEVVAEPEPGRAISDQEQVVPNVKFIGAKGTEKVVDAPSGWSLMEAGVNNDVSGILADCGGACSCATCHVYVDPTWVDRLPPRGEDEEAMLEFAVEPDETSRLSCQIELNGSLDGLVVRVPKSQF